METNNDYKHFLTLSCLALGMLLDDEMYFYFRPAEDKLLMLREYRDETGIAEIKPDPHDRVIKDTLKRFLLQYLSHPDPFGVETMFRSSAFFSREEFEQIDKVATEQWQERKRVAEQVPSRLIQICRDFHLYPEAAGFNTTSWMANCPAHPNHRILLSTESNTWGCPYCNHKGGEAELLEWLQELGKRK